MYQVKSNYENFICEIGEDLGIPYGLVEGEVLSLFGRVARMKNRELKEVIQVFEKMSNEEFRGVLYDKGKDGVLSRSSWKVKVRIPQVFIDKVPEKKLAQEVESLHPVQVDRYEDQCRVCCCYYENIDFGSPEMDQMDSECTHEFDCHSPEPCPIMCPIDGEVDMSDPDRGVLHCYK